jgi:tartrate-resistant acid phosphatase type 5
MGNSPVHRLFFTLFLLLAVALAACGAGEATPLPAPAPVSQVTPTLRPTDPVAPASPVPPTEPPPTATPSPSPSATPTPTDTPTATATSTPESVRFAVIGDYGLAGQQAADVAALVHSWEPDLIITTGDNNYPDGDPATVDANIGQYYADYIYPYLGSYPRERGDERNRFFPTIGNHDINTDGGQHYLDYFTLPGNERYYEFVWEPVHFFAVNSTWNELDGIHAGSVQAQWLQERLAASTSPWRVVYFHTAPYSSGFHGSNQALQWPFAAWGASVVFAGHDHLYEHLIVDGFPYFTIGASGYPALYAFRQVLPQSQTRFNQEYGALRVDATAQEMQVTFITRDGAVIDQVTLVNEE